MISAPSEVNEGATANAGGHAIGWRIRHAGMDMGRGDGQRRRHRGLSGASVVYGAPAVAADTDVTIRWTASGQGHGHARPTTAPADTRTGTFVISVRNVALGAGV